MDAFIGQRFEDFETIAGVNVIKLYGDYLLPVRMGMCLVREILVRLVASSSSSSFSQRSMMDSASFAALR